jgi:putative transposase
MTTIKEAAGALAVAQSCSALGISRATYYRWIDDEEKRAQAEEPALSAPEAGPETGTEGVPAAAPKEPGSVHPRALSETEREAVRDLLNSERFMDMAPAQAYATLLDEGRYLCSIRTMYRILDANGEVRERRDQRRHPVYAAPELLATRPNEVWSWDITRLRGPAKWSYYQL